ncbi:unnamed protein product, partial [Urochloa humidicola]
SLVSKPKTANNNFFPASVAVKGYKEKLVDIREEILHMRRAGKLPQGTASILKAWPREQAGL